MFTLVGIEWESGLARRWFADLFSPTPLTRYPIVRTLLYGKVT